MARLSAAPPPSLPSTRPARTPSSPVVARREASLPSGWGPKPAVDAPVRRISAEDRARLTREQPLLQGSLAGVRTRGRTIELTLALPPLRHEHLARLVADARGVGIVPRLELAPPNPRAPWPHPTREPVAPAPPRPLTRDEAMAVHENLQELVATIRGGQALQQLKPDLPLIEGVLQRLSW